MKTPLRLATLTLCLCIFPVAQARVLPGADMKAFAQSSRTLRKRVRQAGVIHAQKKAARLVALPNLYEKNELALSIRYPAGWERNDLMQAEENLLLAVMFLSPVSPGDTVRENINLVVEDVEPTMTLDEYTRASLEKEKELVQEFHQLSSGRAEVAGQTAQRIVFSASANGTPFIFQQVWYIYRGSAFVWTFADSTQNYAAHVPTFEAMLDSLIVQ